LSSTIATTSTQAATNYPITVTSGGTKVTFTKAPTRIISLSPTATESLFAIGAGSQVIAVDDQSTYPKNAPRTSLSGYSPNLETILAKRPDLIVISYNPSNLLRSLHNAKIPVIMQDAAADLAGSYAQIRQLGRITNHPVGAERVVKKMQAQVNAAVTSLSSVKKSVKFYHELDNTMYSVTSATFIGSLYKKVGLTNIADKADGASYGYPQLSAEYIVKANPSMIFLADAVCCQQSYTTLRARSGFANISAIKLRNVVVLNEDIASRWGPRTPLLLKAIANAVKSMKRS
jgi:iron complex transport system substrate-binding protein